MEARRRSKGIQRELNQTGFARISDELHKKRKTKTTYNFTVEKDTPYIVDANNVHPGENLKLKIKDKKGNTLTKARDSHGSEDPHLTFSVDKGQRVKVIVQVEDDMHNKGKIPYSLAINKYTKRSELNPNAKHRVNLDKSDTSNHSFVAEGKEIPASDNPLSVLWQELSTNQEKIGLNGLDEILGATTSDGSTVSQDEINLLSEILYDLEDHVDPNNLDYYSYIFGAAIGSNPANAHFTGGAKSDDDIQGLGNLSTGFSSEQVTLLQKKWFRGEDLPFAQIDGDSAAGVAPSTFNYALASGDLFDGTPSFTQLSQGHAGTCWFLSSLNAVANAASTSSDITDMFIDNGDGTYGVKFYGPNGNDTAWVTVNKELPITNYYEDSLLMAGSKRSDNLYDGYFVKPRVDLQSAGYGPANLTWAALAEKALAQVNETGLLQRASSDNSYKAIEGGLSLGLDYLTGQSNYNSNSYLIPFSDFESIDPTQDPIWLGSFSKWSGSPSGTTQLVSGHAYAIVDKVYNEATGTTSFKVVNPWGESSFGYDATFMLPSSELESLYNNKVALLASTTW